MSAPTNWSSVPGYLFAIPLLGLLFLSVPWEEELRFQSPEKQWERLNNPRESYLVDAIYNWQNDENWNGLFSWQTQKKHDLDVKLKRGGRDKYGRSLLVYGVQWVNEASDADDIRKQTEWIRGLLAEGADPNLVDTNNKTPLWEVVNVCRSGVDNTDRDPYNEAGQADARRHDVRLIEVTKMLLANNARVDVIVPKEAIKMRSTSSDIPKDMSLVEYAEHQCPDFIVDLLKRQRNN